MHSELMELLDALQGICENNLFFAPVEGESDLLRDLNSVHSRSIDDNISQVNILFHHSSDQSPNEFTAQYYVNEC